MRRFLFRFLAVIAFVVPSTFILTATPATADSPCYSGYVCLYQHNNYEGWVYRTTGNTPDLSCTPYGCLNRDNAASSFRNRGNSCGTRFYNDRNYSGTNSFWLARGGSLSQVSPTFNDRISSYRWC